MSRSPLADGRRALPAIPAERGARVPQPLVPARRRFVAGLVILGHDRVRWRSPRRCSTRYDPTAQNLHNTCRARRPQHWLGHRPARPRRLVAAALRRPRRPARSGSWPCCSRSASARCSAASPATTAAGWTPSIMRLVDVVVAFPFYVLIIALVFVLGPGERSIYIAITLVGWVSYARIIRGEILVAKRQEYVLAARSAGSARLAHHRPAPAAERDHAGGRLRDVRHRARHPRDRHARLPRPRRPAADAGLGHR